VHGELHRYSSRIAHGWASSWGFRNAADLVIDCALAGVTKVRTVLAPQGGGESTVLVNDCTEYTGRSPLLVAGTYDVSFEAGGYAPIVHSGVVIPPRGSASAPPAVFEP
jgi:hypothetical protein